MSLFTTAGPETLDSLEITFKKLLEFVNANGVGGSDWILRTGLWDDAGTWHDDELWID